ncbi:hypothetical protein EsVE80_25190 [Enterococcus saigonensis]|uniref:Uncharacterized protein n=1 Tax=Enterococcus saigonensis TaxID=1805431 RepID=A0A679INX3_9ENTE|nr:hypothetical protein EsVE80_25190 [Enterococcus saigonensis]
MPQQKTTVISKINFLNFISFNPFSKKVIVNTEDPNKVEERHPFKQVNFL